MKPTREEMKEVFLVVAIAIGVMLIAALAGAPMGELLQ